MESPEQRQKQRLKEKRLLTRLQLATTRVKDVERERIWAIAAAHSEGLSIRKIAEVTGLSSSRVHQLLHTNEARQIPDWLNSLSNPNVSTDEQSDGEKNPSHQELQQQLADEGEVIRWCLGWLEQLARGERVVVNLRAESDPKTAYVAVNHEWVLRVLKRVAAALEQLSGNLNPTSEGDEGLDPVAAGVKRRHRLGEPEPELSSLSQREQRAILREKMGLPPM
jgi:hypothetical protein